MSISMNMTGYGEILFWTGMVLCGISLIVHDIFKKQENTKICSCALAAAVIALILIFSGIHLNNKEQIACIRDNICKEYGTENIVLSKNASIANGEFTYNNNSYAYIVVDEELYIIDESDVKKIDIERRG